MEVVTGKLLFADDEPWFFESFRYRLEKEGYEVVFTMSAKETLNILDDSFSLLVLDIMMPEIPLVDLLKLGIDAVVSSIPKDIFTGISLFRKVREKYPDLKIIIYSVLPESDIRKKYPEMSFDCLLLQKGGLDNDEHYEIVHYNAKNSRRNW